MLFHYFDYFIFFLQLVITFFCILSGNPWFCFVYALVLAYFITIMLTDSVPFDQATINISSCHQFLILVFVPYLPL